MDCIFFFFFQAEDGIRDLYVTGVQTCALPIFVRVQAAARRMGWLIVAAAPAEGRLEASDTTRWFGFTDDIVVRVTAAPTGSRIDVRSASRVGRSDLGVNAKRIRAFLALLRS